MCSQITDVNFTKPTDQNSALRRTVAIRNSPNYGGRFKAKKLARAYSNRVYIMFWPFDQRAAWDLELKLHTARAHTLAQESRAKSETDSRAVAVAARVHNMQSGELLNLKFNHSVSNSNCGRTDGNTSGNGARIGTFGNHICTLKTPNCIFCIC